MRAHVAILSVALSTLDCQKVDSPRPNDVVTPIASPVRDAAPDRTTTPWLEAARQKAAGSPVLLVWTGRSLVARTPQGQVLSELPALKSDVLDFEAAGDLLWVRDADRLWVFDLRSPAPRAELIATARADFPGFVVEGPDQPRGYVATSGPCSDPMFALDWTKKPTIDVHDSSIVGTAWLAANWGRRQNSIPPPPGFNADDDYDFVRIPDTNGCDDPRICGRAHPFGSTHWMLVLVNTHSLGCRGDRCLLFSPRTQKYSHPDGPYHWTAFKYADAGSCGPYRFDTSESWYATDDSICRTDGSCEKISGRVLDWTEPGPRAGSMD
jgi:hypothetical protein